MPAPSRREPNPIVNIDAQGFFWYPIHKRETYDHQGGAVPLYLREDGENSFRFVPPGREVGSYGICYLLRSDPDWNFYHCFANLHRNQKEMTAWLLQLGGQIFDFLT